MYRSLAAVLLAALVLPLAPMAAAQPACGPTDLDLIEAVLSTGGTLELDCTGPIEIDEGRSWSTPSPRRFAARACRSRAKLGGPAIRLFDVRGSTLTLEGIDLWGGRVIKANGPNGADGEDGSGGDAGPHGSNGQPGTPGEPGGPATEAEDGADGEDVGGGAMRIDAASTVMLRSCTVTQTRSSAGTAATAVRAAAAAAADRAGTAASDPAWTEATAGAGATAALRHPVVTAAAVAMRGAAPSRTRATGLGLEVDCVAAGATCAVPEPDALALGLTAGATCAALRRRAQRS